MRIVEMPGGDNDLHNVASKGTTVADCCMIICLRQDRLLSDRTSHIAHIG
jgi:hypothetical protein